MGFQVTAIEAAPALAALARAETGLPVEVMTFDQIAWRGAFDGIWACASLLHVPREHLADTLTRLRDALAPNGLLWMSFKLGTQDRRESGRLFTDMNQDGVTALLAEVGGLALLEMEISDGRGYQADMRWLAVTCRRST